VVAEVLRDMSVFLKKCGRGKTYQEYVQGMINATDQVIDRLQPDAIKDAANGKQRKMKQVH
jgi:hypothetical protein